ncbi:TRAP transporter large permease [Pseudonocardia pini]|uniref:TRAP transporter large permease n=1 Tax=Pseudonocardia pini TaxID=2758030 RepID=UPI0015F008F0|nr:TRAP transporter large permease [Pseudonocardia pini]
MNATMIVLVAFAVLLVLIAAEMPIAFAMIFAGGVGLVLLRSFEVTTATFASLPFTSTASYGLTVIPMYILLGAFALHGRFADQIFAFAARILRRAPGGLGVATVGASAVFGAVSGSTAAAAVTIGRLTVPRMLAAGYSRRLAGGIAAIGGTLDCIIPPSIVLVIYAVLTQQSTAAMLVAGIVPGILSAIVYSLYIMVRALQASRHITVESPASELVTAGGGPPPSSPSAATVAESEPAPSPRAPDLDGPALEPPARPSAGYMTVGLVKATILFGIVIGGIYTGVFTPTESGAIGAAAALVMLLIDFRGHGGRALGTVLKRSLSEAAATTSMVVAIIFGAAVFSSMLVVSKVPQRLAAWMSQLDVPGPLLLAIVLLLLIPLGMFLETLSILTIVVPFLHPVLLAFGLDPVWVGILIVKVVALGMITPPVGIISFVVAGAVRELNVVDVFKGVMPFVVIDLVLVAGLFAFPELVTWLPAHVT